MGIDPISPISPARVKALLLPIGKIKRTTFKDAVARLLSDNVVRLGDISAENKPGKTTFSPLAFPNGSIIYDLQTTVPPAHHASLSPFETFRVPFVVLGIADGSKISTGSNGTTNDDNDLAQRTVETLRRELHDISSEIDGAISTQLLIFNINETLSASPGVIHIPPKAQSRSTTIKTVMCDISAAFLGNLADFARDIQSWSDVETPSTTGTRTLPSHWPSDLVRQEAGSTNSRPTSPESDVSAPRSNPRPVTIASMDHLSGPPNSHSRPNTPQENIPYSNSKAPSEGGLTRTSTIDQRLGAPLQSRPNSVSRESSRDRRSILHSSSSNATERAKTKLKARQGIILGTLHLQSGRWNDALRELVDAATKAQTISDHVWFAKGLENILATLLLLAWSGSDFQIPRICLPNQPKSKQSTIPENSKLVEQNASHSLAALPPILPELVQMILSNYARGANFQGEALLSFPYSECVIRLCYILALLCRGHGTLDPQTVRSIVLGSPLPAIGNTPLPDKGAKISRREVVTLLFQAYPNQPSIGPVATLDATIVFSGMAAVLSLLKLERKRALILRNLLTMLVPSMIQARKVGAAEVGIHPAASLAAAQSISASSKQLQSSEKFTLEQSLHNIMYEVCQIYGVDFVQDVASESSNGANGEPERDTKLEEVVARFWKRTTGDEPVKVDILQLCVNLADAIPNFQDVTYFAAALLRTVGPDEVAEIPSPGTASLAKEEQLRLRSRIMRTHGMKIHCEVEYWDDFLIRDLKVFESNPQQRVMGFNKNDIAGYSGSTHDAAAASATGPFLHNPFLKDASEIEARNVIVAEETTEFIITVQNPYEFEIILENISLVFEGTAFMQKPQGITIGPNKAQRVVVTAVAQDEGEIKILGCNIKVQGCHEKFFHVFPTTWRPHPDEKIKAKQISSNITSSEELLAKVPESYSKEMLSALKPAVLELQVIPQQPYLELSATSLSQSAVTLLEGETRYFTVTVRNTSKNVAVDFANLAFEHSPKVWVVQGTRTSADAAAIYEAEYIATHRPPFKWIKEDNFQQKIAPGETATFTIAVFGRMGLSEGIVQIDYANIGGPLESVEGKVHTRRLLIPVSITVSASVFLQRVDVIPLRNSELQSLAGGLKSAHEGSDQSQLDGTESSHSHDAFLLVMDFKNSWSRSLSVRTVVNDSDDDDKQKTPRFQTQDVLEPDRISRVVVTCPKLFVSNPHRPIPPPASAKNSQYLFDANKGNEDDLSALRSFWYRQKLLSVVDITWKEPSSKREGVVDLRGITLTPTMAAAIQQDTFEIRLSLANTDTASPIDRAKDGTYSVSADDFITMTITLVNRSPSKLRPFLSVSPRLSHRPRGAPVDLAKLMAWTGQLRSALQIVEPGDSLEQVMGWTLMSPGSYEIEIVADKYQPRSRASFSNTTPSNHLGRAVCSIVSRNEE